MPTPSMYDYESKLADLHKQYNDESATNQYARFMSQQRFSRQADDANRGFQRAFPSFTGRAAARQGSGVQSGVFRQKLGEFTGDYNRGVAQLQGDQAGADAQFGLQAANSQSAYQRALLLLQEEMDRQRAMSDPYGNVGP